MKNTKKNIRKTSKKTTGSAKGSGAYMKGGPRRRRDEGEPERTERRRDDRRSGSPAPDRGTSADRRKRFSPSTAARRSAPGVRPDARRNADDYEDRSEFVVVGKNPVLEALRSDLQIEKLLVLKDNSDHVLKDLTERAKKQKLVVQSVEKQQLENLADGLPHQGVAAMLAPFPYADLEKTVEGASRGEAEPFFVIMDHITDPHNFGAVIRDANVCGAAGVIFPARRSAGLSPTAVKASSGAAAHTPLIKVTNLTQTVEYLKEQGYWVAGADMDGQPYYQSNLKGKTVIILGAEGKGLSPNLKKKCDFSVSIPVYGKVDSLNVSCAGAVIMAEAARQRHTDTK
ncbi:MAG: 23S rRNA (guanosine(2251)-2'-O)-methyltransferase RlmB [Eubacteriaceae bacterium]|jgi:23S rRNA (guanosine2251-2'-O)-methyltransferase